MARRVFFSFHYEADVWRAGQVRNSWVTKDRESAGFWDAAAWEEVKKKGETAIENWIDNQLNGTSVTVILIGEDTASRPYVGYEIKQSHGKGNGLVGISIHNLKDSKGKIATKGNNPLSNWHIQQNGQKVLLSSIYPTYDWINDDGRANMGNWIETAAKKAGR
jgi:hypothetical protein